MPRNKQLALSFKPTGRGGWRPGAGRKRVFKSRIAHRTRETVRATHPMLITLRVRKDVPRLRNRRFVRSFQRTLCACSSREGFRVVHYSIQRDHVHLLIEAASNQTLANGMKSLGARFARSVNRVFDRSGPVLKERFHSVVKATPLEVRRALAYVLLNVRKHCRKTKSVNPPVAIDEASSGRWFRGWRHGYSPPPPDEIPEISRAESWLLGSGWRRHGLIDLAEVPNYEAAI